MTITHVRIIQIIKLQRIYAQLHTRLDLLIDRIVRSGVIH